MICDVPTYRILTGDGAGGSVDGDVTTALTFAQNVFESATSREFESAQRTEVMRLYYNGRVYPKAFPITSISSTNPSNVIDGASVILGYGYQYAEGINPFVSGFGADTSNYQPQVTITYVGGYTAQTMPFDVVRAVAGIAYTILHPVVLAGVPVGATSVRLGDAAISGTALAPFAVITADAKKVISAYKRPQAEPF